MHKLPEYRTCVKTAPQRQKRCGAETYWRLIALLDAR